LTIAVFLFIITLRCYDGCAEVVELVDALRSGRSGSNPVGVRVPPSAPFQLDPSSLMKKISLIIPVVIVVVLTGCAGKKEVFDAAAVFKDAEESMQKHAFEKARKGYQQIQEKSPDKSYDAALMLRVADTYFGEEKYDEALVEYQAFLNYHPMSKDAAYAQYQIAMCSFNQFTTIDRDPNPTRTALKEYEKLLQKYPKSIYEGDARGKITICRDRIAEYELYVGRFYYKKGSYKSAIGRLEKLLHDYPGSIAEKDALYYTGLSYTDLGDREKALVAFETLVKKYPSVQGSVGPLMAKLRTK
jgi:outer membrane protein assembly factor BamD